MAASNRNPFPEAAFRRLPLAVMLGLAAAAAVSGAGWSTRLAAWPWLLALVGVGLPHGAADLAVGRRAHGLAAVVRFGAVYLALMVVVAAFFAAAPAVVLVAFGILSGWHFGLAHADGEGLATPGCGASRPRLVDIAGVAVACGGFALGVPLFAWPDETARVVAEVTALAGHAAPFTAGAVRHAGLGLLAAAGVAAILAAARFGGRADGLRRLGRLAVDLAVIGLLAVACDPLFAVGVYFLVWHSWREMRLLAATVGGGEPTGIHDLVATLVRIHAAALPLLLPAWAALAMLWWLLPADHLARTPRGLAILSLALYIVVTPSHDLLIEVMRAVRSRRIAGRADRPFRRAAA